MTDWRRLLASPITAGVLAVGCVTAAMLAAPTSVTQALRERALDQTLLVASKLRAAPAAAPRIVIVDIDAAALASLGPWPWPREKLAALVEAVGEAGAASIAIDILFEGADAKSLATIARRLGEGLQRDDILRLADTLPDGDKKLTEALARFPVALGFALDPSGVGQVPAVPFLTQGAPPSLAGIWRSRGAIGPATTLSVNAAGMGVLALPGDVDGVVRRVPLLVAVGEQVHPGLALEAIRLAQNASAYRLDGEAAALVVGEIRGTLAPDGFLRLVPRTTEAVKVVSASQVLARQAPDILRGAIVFIGSSAPELGGLRPSLGDPLMPSVRIQAEAASQFIAGVVPHVVRFPGATEWLLAALAAALGIFAAVLLPPLAGAATAVAIATACWATAMAAAQSDRLLNPLPASILAASAFAATAIIAYTQARRREARIRQRFEQHLAPQVVDLIAADPSLLKLRGERREITTMFTDVEGFTAMTQRSEPETLVHVLDEYFEGIAKIVVAHGGMVDKLIGDAVHALFNAPLDLPDHPAKAVRCAQDILAWTEAFRRGEAPGLLGFGRTRIGIETGEAIVGDIGVSSKLDYTAHGDVVNSAARLEAANKELGSSICIGPGTASRCDQSWLRPIGELVLRGFAQPVAAFEPWPSDADASWRSRYLTAMQRVAHDCAAAAAGLELLAAERPHDPVPAILARKLRSAAF
jgi:adenylate cyclase